MPSPRNQRPSSRPLKHLSLSLVILLMSASTAWPQTAVNDVGDSRVSAAATDAPITVTNHKDGSTVRYSVVLLRGTLTSNASALAVSNSRATEKAAPATAVLKGRDFKVLVQLSPGENQLTLKTVPDETSVSFSLNYEPQTNPYYVRLVWLTDSSGETDFAAPDKSTPQTYENRLRTAALLMQSMTAERMFDMGFGRRTFRLERDSNHEIVVHTWKAPEPASEYRDLSGSYGPIYRWLNREHPDRFAKNIVLTAFTRKDPETGELLAHTALGGGNLGLFGSGSVFSWPESIGQATEVFADDRRVDPTRVHEDSAGRGTYWGVASTTIGATLHEMGHTFGLPHCKERFGIMTRGFDHFNRVFTFTDPVSGHNRKPRTFTREEEAAFAPISASFLQWSPWFQLDTPDEGEQPRPRITIDQDARQVIVASKAGIPWVGFWVDSDILTHREIKESPLPQEVTFTFDEITRLTAGKPFSRISTIDALGRSTVARPRP